VRPAAAELVRSATNDATTNHSPDAFSGCRAHCFARSSGHCVCNFSFAARVGLALAFRRQFGGSSRRRSAYADVRLDAGLGYLDQTPDKIVGSAFVRRMPGVDQVLVLEPHHHGALRVGVTYDEPSRAFQSCWRIRFDLEGHELPDPDLPPMGDRMERLPVRVVEGQVFVQWKDR